MEPQAWVTHPSLNKGTVPWLPFPFSSKILPDLDLDPTQDISCHRLEPFLLFAWFCFLEFSCSGISLDWEAMSGLLSNLSQNSTLSLSNQSVFLLPAITGWLAFPFQIEEANWFKLILRFKTDFGFELEFESDCFPATSLQVIGSHFVSHTSLPTLWCLLCLCVCSCMLGEGCLFVSLGDHLPQSLNTGGDKSVFRRSFPLSLYGRL